MGITHGGGEAGLTFQIHAKAGYKESYRVILHILDTFLERIAQERREAGKTLCLRRYNLGTTDFLIRIKRKLQGTTPVEMRYLEPK